MAMPSCVRSSRNPMFSPETTVGLSVMRSDDSSGPTPRPCPRTQAPALTSVATRTTTTAMKSSEGHLTSYAV